MGYALYRVEQLGSPFLIVHEPIFLIPKGGCHPVVNFARKLIFIIQGECRHQVVGATGPGTDVHLKAGDILVLPHRCTHHYLSLQPGTAVRIHALRLAFDPVEVPPLALGERRLPDGGDPETDLAALARQQFSAVHHLPDGQDASIREVLRVFREEAQQRPPGYRLRIRGLCTSLTTLVARKLMEAPGLALAPDGQRGLHHVNQAKDYLLRHLDQPLHLEDVAAHVQLSEEYLARLFKQVTGQTVFDYIRQMRFEQAKIYLSGSDLNVSEIALRTGFGSLSVFSRSFKRELGMSPSDYRRQIAAEIG